jgi:hypothetical protein
LPGAIGVGCPALSRLVESYVSGSQTTGATSHVLAPRLVLMSSNWGDVGRRQCRDASIGSGTTDMEIDLMVTVYALSAFGWTASAVVFLFIWVAIAFWPARVARRKGHSFIGYFIFSLFFFPLALITAYLVRDRRAPAY